MKKKYIIIALSNNDYHKNMLFEEEGWKIVPKPNELFDNWYKVVSPRMFWRVLKRELKQDIENDEFGFYELCYERNLDDRFKKWFNFLKKCLKNGDGNYSTQVNNYLFKTIKEGDEMYELFS